MGGGRKRRDRGFSEQEEEGVTGVTDRVGCRAWRMGGGVGEDPRQQQTGGVTDPR